MTQSVIQPSFAGGEMSPKLYGRVDTTKYRMGCRQLLNFFVHPSGGASNRPGTEFVGEIADSSKRGRLIPFQFNGQVTYVLEFGDRVMRVIKDGGYVLSAPNTIFHVTSPYAVGDLPLLKYTQSADVMTICHPSYAPQDLGRTGDAAWTFTPVSFAPQIAAPIGLTAGGSAGSVTARYRVTAVNASDTEESLPALWNNGGAGITNITKANPCLVVAANSFQNGDEIIIQSVGGMGQVINQRYLVANNTGAQFNIQNYDNTSVDSTGFSTYTGGGFATPTFIRVVFATPTATAPVNIFWNGVAGAAKYNIYKEDSGTFGYIGSSNSSSFSDTNIKPDTTDGPPSGRNPFTGNNWPSTVAYHEQRKFFANSTKQPQTFWATQTGNFKNMNVSSPTKDDDAITRTLVASQVNAIKHMVSMNVLILLTSGAEWKCFAGVNNDAITPTNCYTKPQSYNGCSELQPLLANSSILYVQEKGSIVRDIQYDFATDSYTGTDRSVWADHLFLGHKIIEWGYAQEPFRIVWAVRDDGILLGFTYMKEQDVYAWHRHTTDGVFESVAVISEDSEDVPYFIVQRTINGQTKRYVERMHSRLYDSIADAWFLDCALEYDGDPTSSVIGLDHLEGETVSILGDGNAFPAAVVTGGSVTLDNPASKIIIGLPYVAELETLDLDVGDPTIQGKRKKISAVTVKTENTRGLKSGGVYESGAYSRMTEIKERGPGNQPGQSIPLTTGQERVILDPTWNSNGRVVLRQDNPLPCTILAVIPEVDLGN